MSATEELRRLLDERGVEWGNVRNDGSKSDHLTEWEFEGIQSYAVATEYSIGGGLSLETHRHYLTPEQAIAATVRRGECEIETTENWLPAERYHRCKHCGAFFAVMNASGDIQPCVCPNCGRKVKR